MDKDTTRRLGTYQRTGPSTGSRVVLTDLTSTLSGFLRRKMSTLDSESPHSTEVGEVVSVRTGAHPRRHSVGRGEVGTIDLR